MNSWEEIESPGLNFNGGVAALRKGNKMYAFATTNDNRLKCWLRIDGAPGQWQDLGQPAAQFGMMKPRLCVTEGLNPIEIFAVSEKGRLLHKAWGGIDWLLWEVLG